MALPPGFLATQKVLRRPSLKRCWQRFESTAPPFFVPTEFCYRHSTADGAICIPGSKARCRLFWRVISSMSEFSNCRSSRFDDAENPTFISGFADRGGRVFSMPSIQTFDANFTPPILTAPPPISTMKKMMSASHTCCQFCTCRCMRVSTGAGRLLT